MVKQNGAKRTARTRAGWLDGWLAGWLDVGAGVGKTPGNERAARGW